MLTALAAIRIDRMVRHLSKGAYQPSSKNQVCTLLGDCLGHAMHTFVAHDLTDHIRRMAHAQVWMAFFLHVQWWTNWPGLGDILNFFS